jgi:predicted amidohydrolase
MRLALASLPFPTSLEDAVSRVGGALAEAARRGARLMCTPENYLPGLRNVGHPVAPVDPSALAAAMEAVAERVRASGVALVLGTEVPTPRGLLASAAVFGADGVLLGRQDKVQLDPDEEGTYVPGVGRAVFDVEGLHFGVAICHEGWRYPETVRWAARQGARLVLHPHYGAPLASGRPPAGFADRANTFHEKAALCRAAENTVYFATVNYAVPAGCTTSAVVAPDGTLLAHLPHGEAGLLVTDLEPSRATGRLASRFRPADHEAAQEGVSPALAREALPTGRR